MERDPVAADGPCIGDSTAPAAMSPRFGLGRMRQRVPFQRSISRPPKAQTSVVENAASTGAWAKPAFAQRCMTGIATACQELPSQWSATG